MWSPDRNLAITFNGEIYNYIELKKDLSKKPYVSGTDTEVILRAYGEWGKRCVERFNGIFSFGIWDAERKEFFGARDRLGVKPFYYTVSGGRCYFASEMKALLEAGMTVKPNERMIYEYLTYGFYDHSEETFFEGIRQLMPGHTITVRDGKVKVERYWHLPDEVRDLGKITDAEASEGFLSLLKDSVRMQLRSDVPVGLSVSGGLDSSLLMATVHDVAGGQRNFSAYHFAYEGEAYEAEVPHVEAAARHMGWTKPTVVTVTERDMRELLPKIFLHEEQPFPGLPTVAWHKLYEHLGKTETVVTFEGHGGDEMVAGYDYYVSSFLLDVLRGDGGAAMRREFDAFARVRGISEEKRLAFFTNGLEASFRGGISADASSFAKPECLGKRFREGAFPMPKFETPFESFLSNFQYRELLHTKLPRVLRSVDRESMAHGRELRVPLLDHRLVEFAFSLPIHQRMRDGEQRFVMRRAARELLPKAIAETPKRSLPNPQREWFQKGLAPWIGDVLRSASFGSRPYFNQRAVVEEFERYRRDPKPVNSFHVWQWLSVELWLRTFVD
jgi:asparagine synthase (glutamine-hydrolysing)